MQLIHGDCLEESNKIVSGTVDLILTDLPFGTMNGLDVEPIKADSDKDYVAGGGYKKGYSWDAIIEPVKIYDIANRILRKNGKMVLFCQEPFTTKLINEAIPNVPFNYRAIWEKNDFANCLSAKKAMVNYYEDILIFTKRHAKHDFDGVHPLRPYARKIMAYCGSTLKQINHDLGHRRAEHFFYVNSTQFGLCTDKTYVELTEYYDLKAMPGFMSFSDMAKVNKIYRDELLTKMNKEFPSIFNLWDGGKCKSNILKYKKDYNGYHPTQKPVLLLEDLIRTFSNENNLVVDLTMGSGSTGEACANSSREFLGIEKDKTYFDIGVARINAL